MKHVLLSSFVVFLFMPVCIQAHLCLINPAQRGDMEIGETGSKTCFRHGAPCGGQEAGQGPFEVWNGGEQTLIRWNQNFNHYEVGFPGYMDVAIATVNSSDWQTLAFAADKYVYAQYHQQNYSAFIIAPDRACEHCVVRARYVPHKPGEQTFYQCADVTIKSSSEAKIDNTIPDVKLMQYPEYRDAFKKVQTLTQNSQIMQNSGLSLRGFAYTPFDHNKIYIVNVTFDGVVRPFGQFDLDIDFNIKSTERLTKKLSERDRKSARYWNDPEHMMFILDSVCTVNNRNNLVVLYHEDGNMDSPAMSMIEFDSMQGTIVRKSVIDGIYDSYLSAIMAGSDDTYYTFSMQSDESGYLFTVGQLFYTNQTLGQYTYRSLVSSDPESLYVNYQWAEIDEEHGRVFVLMGNENEPIRLLNRLYTFNLKTKSVSIVGLQTEMSSFMNIHYYKKTGKLYAASPGFVFRTYWNVIEIDVKTGKTTPMWPFQYWAFEGYFGGSIFSGIDQSTGILYHVFRMQDSNTDVIGAIDLENKNVTYSPVTNLRFVHNLSLTRN